jgi:hypothetical protein
MPLRQLRENTGTGVASIPKDLLREADLVKDDGSIRQQPVKVEHAGGGVFVLRVADEAGSLPALRDTELARRAAAERLLDRESPGGDRDPSIATGD